MTRLLILAVFAFASVAQTADLTGIWTGQYKGRSGEMLEITFQLKQNGNVLTGKQYTEAEDLPIKEAKVVGDQIEFSTSTIGLGGEIRFVFRGTIKGDGVIEGTRVRDDAQTRARPEDKRPKPDDLVLKKMT